jgi:hypothetical protein
MQGHTMTCLGRQRAEADVQFQPIRNLALKRCVLSAPGSGRFTRERAGTHRTAGLVTFWVGLHDKENLALTGFRSPELPARSEPLY